jgi:hypothetical protein
MNIIAYIKILHRGIHSYFTVVGYIKFFLATDKSSSQEKTMLTMKVNKEIILLCLDCMLKVEECLCVS